MPGSGTGTSRRRSRHQEIFAFGAVQTTHAAGAGCLLTARHDAKHGRTPRPQDPSSCPDHRRGQGRRAGNHLRICGRTQRGAAVGYPHLLNAQPPAADYLAPELCPLSPGERRGTEHRRAPVPHRLTLRARPLQPHLAPSHGPGRTRISRVRPRSAIKLCGRRQAGCAGESTAVRGPATRQAWRRWPIYALTRSPASSTCLPQPYSRGIFRHGEDQGSATSSCLVAVRMPRAAPI